MVAPKITKVYFALPTYSNSIRRDCFVSLMELFCFNPIPNVEFTIGTVGGDGVGRSRNNLAQNFLLTTDCDIFFTVDADISFTRDDVARLVSFCTPERPIVGGLYAAKQINHRWIATDLPNEQVDPETGLKRVQECGTGFKATHRTYFERVIAAFPEIAYFCDASGDRPMKWDFYSMGVVNSRYLSEDYYADYRARTIGMDIFVDTKCEVKHEGFMLYPFTKNHEMFKDVPIAEVVDSLNRVRSGQFLDQERVIQTRITPPNEWSSELPRHGQQPVTRD